MKGMRRQSRDEDEQVELRRERDMRSRMKRETWRKRDRIR